VAEQKLRQPEVVRGALQLRCRGVPPSVHVHAARRPLGNEAGALKTAVPPAMSESSGRLAVVTAARDIGVTDPLPANREYLFGFLGADAHAASVLAIEEPVLIAPLRFEIQTAENLMHMQMTLSPAEGVCRVVGLREGPGRSTRSGADEVTVFDHTSSSRRMLLANHSPVLSVVRSNEPARGGVAVMKLCVSQEPRARLHRMGSDRRARARGCARRSRPSGSGGLRRAAGPHPPAPV